MNNQHTLYNPQLLGSGNVNIELLAQAQTMQTVAATAPVQYTYTTEMPAGHHAVNLAAPAHIVTTAQEVQAVGGIPVVYQAAEPQPVH